MNGAKKTMVITWLDGKQESYEFTHQRTANGELHIWTEYGGGSAGRERWNEYWFPVDGIRVRSVAD